MAVLSTIKLGWEISTKDGDKGTQEIWTYS